MGGTAALDFPVTAGAFQTVLKHSGTPRYNVFVTKFNPAGSALVYSTYLGGTRGGDEGASVAIDGSGNAYVVGSASSSDFPVTPGAFQTKNVGSDLSDGGVGFATKLNPAGTALIYSTYLEGTGGPSSEYNGDSALSIAVDSAGTAYVAGITTSLDFPTTIGAFQRTHLPSGTHAGFLTRLNAAGSAPIYSTYLGGSGYDNACEAIALDTSNSACTVGETTSRDFPITPGAFQTTHHGPANNLYIHNGFVTKLAMMPVFPDFNSDGFTDILLQNPTTGTIASWFMQGARWGGGAAFSAAPRTDLALIGAGDFSGDGTTTLVLQARSSPRIALCHLGGVNNAVVTGVDYVSPTPNDGWRVVGVGDFNGDGKSDLLFQNQTTGQLVVWYMNGYLDQGGVLLPFAPVAGWKVVGTGDFNADGLTDIVFQNQTTGQLAVWYMNGTAYLGGEVLRAVPSPGWKVVGVGDYNGDGYADLLFQNQNSSQAVVWYLQNGSLTGGEALSVALPPGWQIAGPR